MKLLKEASATGLGGLFLLAFTLSPWVTPAQSLNAFNPLEKAKGYWSTMAPEDFRSAKGISFRGNGQINISEYGEGNFEFLKNHQYRLVFSGNGAKSCRISVISNGPQEMEIVAVADETGHIDEKCSLGKLAFKFDDEAGDEFRKMGSMGQGAPEDLRALSCRALEVGESIRQGKRVVPKTLYHFGGKANLLKNDKFNGIPEAEWNNSIMSGKGRFALKPFRRGFYGGADTNDISFYSFVRPDDFYYNQNAKISWSWLIKFTLKDECRQPEKVATLVGLPTNPVFRNWFSKTLNKEDFQSVEAFAETCFIGDDLNPEAVEDTSSYKELNPCERIFNDFLVDSDAKIVHDAANSRSFYVRDRSCIESMSASPQEILKMFSEKETRFLFTTQCPSDLNPTGQPSGGDYLLYLIVSAISDLKGDIEPQMLDALLEGPQIATAGSYTFKNNAPEFLEALKRCRAKRNLNEFNETLDKFLEKGYPLISNRELGVRFRPICR